MGHIAQDLDDAAFGHAVEDGGFQGTGPAAHLLGLAALEYRNAILADDHLAVLQIALIGQLGDLRQARLQGIDEAHGRGRQHHVLAVILQQRLALLPRQQLFAVVGVGFRSAHSHVARFQFVGQR